MGARSDAAEIAAGAHELARRVAALEPRPGAPRRLHAALLVAGLLLGALGTLVLRRRSSGAADTVAGWQPSDDELAELLSTPDAEPRSRRVRPR